MKYFKLVIFFLAFSLMTSISFLFAQDEDSKEMSVEEWKRQKNELTTSKNELENQLNSLNSDVENLKKLNKDILEKLENDLYALVGSTKSQVADYRRKFEALEKKINSASGTLEDRSKSLAEIEASNIRCLPEFWDRFQAMKKKLSNG